MTATLGSTGGSGVLGAQNGEAPAVGARGTCTVSSKVLHGGRSEGLDVIEIDNGALRVAVLPQRGMGVWKAWLGDLELGWRSPVRGPVHPSHVPLFDPNGLGWLEGFDELLCRCGLASNGAPDFDERGIVQFPLHGRIANLPADTVRTVHEPGSGSVSLTGVVHETRFHFQKLRLTSTLTMAPGEAAFSVHDEITNLSDTPATAQLLYHFNLGLPLLEPGARIVAPVRNLAPRNERAAAGLAHWDICGAPDASYTEQVYFMDLLGDADGNTVALLKNAAGDRGASVHFN